MKRIFFTSLSLLIINNLFSQGTCSNIKIESPVVDKPTEGSVVFATCSTLVVQWKGSMNQTYIIQATSKNPADVSSTTLGPTSRSCDFNSNCKAAITVLAGATVSWSVQAVSVIDNRTFYSYPFRGEQDYAIPNCVTGPIANPVVNTEKTIVPVERDKTKVELYPNPVRSTLNINLKAAAETEGNKAVIRIFDVNGRAVLVKQAAIGNVQINVRRLSNGTYFVNVHDAKGKVLHRGKFIKE